MRRLDRTNSARRGRLRRVAGALAAALLALAAAPAPPAAAAGLVPLSGAGSTWAMPAIQQWDRDVQEHYLLAVDFNGNGSAEGRQNYMQQEVDFAASDIAFLTQGDPFGGGIENPAYSYSYIPIVAGGTTFMYNLTVDGSRVKNLRLSGPTIAGIFTGHITNWDDPAITRDYGKQLPNIPITVVTRSDGSGASYQFTEWLATQYASQWNAFCASAGGPATNCGPTEFYPGFSGSIQKDGSDQVAGFLASPVSNGAIGYDEYAYAINYNVPVVKVENAAGYYTQPTAYNVAIALQAAIINEDSSSPDFLMQDLHNVYTNPDSRAYPLSSYSYLIVPRDSSNTGKPPPSTWTDAKGASMSQWINWAVCKGQQEIDAIGYSALPENLVQGAFEQLGHIPGHTDPADINTCGNPTYASGQDILITEAPQPSPCDYYTAPIDCTIVNGKAVSTDSGSGGSAGAGAGAGSGAATGPQASNSAGASGAGGNGAGGGAGGGGSGGSGQTIYSEPVAVAAKPYNQSLSATLAVLELLGAICAPVLIGYALQRRRRGVKP
ncbi:MAG TPA: substrate-binding domain-containing protein [Actinocrinis sp.]|jgi:phosphate ABC transporter phosphate-binding protein